MGSGALSDKILFVRIVENNRIDDKGKVRLSKCYNCPTGLASFSKKMETK